LSPRIRIPWRRTAPEPPLTCRELVGLVTDYWEGALSPAERTRFERHIDGCEHCTVYLEQLRLTVEVAHTLEPAALDAEMERDLLAAFRTWNAEERR
jgi:anti-sigma factor RsiW